MLPPEIVDRLSKICGLLGSDKDGERSAAAWHASQLLFEHKLTWRQLVEAACPRPDSTKIDIEDDPTVWRNQVGACLACPWQFTAWELGFLRTLAARRHPPSEKQQLILTRLALKATS